MTSCAAIVASSFDLISSALSSIKFNLLVLCGRGSERYELHMKPDLLDAFDEEQRRSKAPFTSRSGIERAENKRSSIFNHLEVPYYRRY